MDTAFLLRGKEPDDGRLYDGNQGHVGVGRDDDGADIFGPEIICNENGGRSVRSTDDGDGGGILHLKSEKRSQAQCKEDTELGGCTEDHKLRVGKQRSEIDHRSDAYEEEEREEFICDPVIEQDGDGAFLDCTVHGLCDGSGQGQVDQDRAETDRQKQRRFHFLLDGEIDQDPSDDPHDDLLYVQIQDI